MPELVFRFTYLTNKYYLNDLVQRIALVAADTIKSSFPPLRIHDLRKTRKRFLDNKIVIISAT